MTKITISEVEGEIDYISLMKEFGISDIEPYLKKLRDLDPMYRRVLYLRTVI